MTDIKLGGGSVQGPAVDQMSIEALLREWKASRSDEIAAQRAALEMKQFIARLDLKGDIERMEQKHAQLIAEHEEAHARRMEAQAALEPSGSGDMAEQIRQMGRAAGLSEEEIQQLIQQLTNAPQTHLPADGEGEQESELAPYIVRAGDTLREIAERFEMELDALVEHNPQLEDPDPDQPLVEGMSILVPEDLLVEVRAPPAPEPGDADAAYAAFRAALAALLEREGIEYDAGAPTNDLLKLPAEVLFAELPALLGREFAEATFGIEHILRWFLDERDIAYELDAGEAELRDVVDTNDLTEELGTFGWVLVETRIAAQRAEDTADARLAQLLRDNGIDVNEGATLEELERLAAEHGFRLRDEELERIFISEAHAELRDKLVALLAARGVGALPGDSTAELLDRAGDEVLAALVSSLAEQYAGFDPLTALRIFAVESGLDAAGDAAAILGKVAEAGMLDAFNAFATRLKEIEDRIEEELGGVPVAALADAMRAAGFTIAEDATLLEMRRLAESRGFTIIDLEDGEVDVRRAWASELHRDLRAGLQAFLQGRGIGFEPTAPLDELVALVPVGALDNLTRLLPSSYAQAEIDIGALAAIVAREHGQISTSAADPDAVRALAEAFGIRATRGLRSASTEAREVTPDDFATRTELPPAIRAIFLSGDADAFKQAFLAAREKGEAWAVALEAEAIEQQNALAEYLDSLQPEDEGTEETQDSPPPENDRVELPEDFVRRLAREPWMLAVIASTEAQAAAYRARSQDQMTDVEFDDAPAQPMTPEEKRRHEEIDERTGLLKDPSIPTATDGSMKVPEPKDRYVTEYLRTNPVIEEMRRGAMAHMWNPLYAFHVAALAMENGGDEGPPPEGKGYLAMTEHGFAWCWNDKLSAEQNRKVAEFSLRTGMLFEKCDGMNDLDNSIDAALEQLNNFDPNVKGELKILLDRTSHGYDKISITSDGTGNVTCNYYFKPDRGEHFKDQCEKYGLVIAAVVVTVVSWYFGYPANPTWIQSAWHTAAVYASAAVGVQSAYQAARRGDWMSCVLQLAMIYASWGQGVFKEGSDAFKIARTVGDAARAVSAVKTIYAGIKNGDVKTALSGVASAAAAIASINGTWGSTELANTWKEIADFCERYGTAYTFGVRGMQALEQGDYFTAFACAAEAVCAALGPDRISPATVEKIKAAAASMRALGSALKAGDYAGALQHLLEGVQALFDDKKDPNMILSGAIAVAGLVSEIRAHDPAGAAKVIGEFLKDLHASRDDLAKQRDAETDPVKRGRLSQLISDVDRYIDKMGGARLIMDKAKVLRDAVEAKDAARITAAAADLAQVLSLNGRADAALRVVQDAALMAAAIERGASYTELLANAQRLGRSLADATDVFGGRPLCDLPADFVELHRRYTTDHAGLVEDIEAAYRDGRMSQADYLCATSALVDAEGALYFAKVLAEQGDEAGAAEQLKFIKARLEEAAGYLTAGFGAADPVLAATVRDRKADAQGLRATLEELRAEHRIDDAQAECVIAALDAADAKLAAAEAALKSGDEELARTLVGEAIGKLNEAAAALAEKEPPQRVTVGKNDTLSGLALRWLGDASRWPELYQWNIDRGIKAADLDPRALKPGITLEIPPADYRVDDARRREILALDQPKKNEAPLKKSDVEKDLSRQRASHGTLAAEFAGDRIRMRPDDERRVDTLLREADEALSIAQSLIARGDLATARQLIRDAEQRLADAKQLLEKYEQPDVSNNPKPAPGERGGVSRVRGELFPGGVNGISSADVRQGALGDCYFAGAMMSLASTPEGRQAIYDAIHDNKDGTYSVFFWKGSPPNMERVEIRVTAEVPFIDGQPQYGRPGESGAIWFPIMEKAWAVFAGGGTYGGIVAGYADTVFRAVTGKNPAQNFVKSYSLSELRRFIEDNLAKGNPVALSTYQPSYMWAIESFFGGLVNNHTYAVLAIEDGPLGPVVTLRDPTGGKYAPAGHENGVFKIPLAQVFVLFETIFAGRT